MSLDNLESRVQRLEDLVGIEEQDLPIIYIYSKDCSKNANSKARPSMAIIPGKPGRPGLEISKAQGESPEEFLDRVEEASLEFYNDQAISELLNVVPPLESH